MRVGILVACVLLGCEAQRPSACTVDGDCADGGRCYEGSCWYESGRGEHCRNYKTSPTAADAIYRQCLEEATCRFRWQDGGAAVGVGLHCWSEATPTCVADSEGVAQVRYLTSFGGFAGESNSCHPVTFSLDGGEIAALRSDGGVWFHDYRGLDAGLWAPFLEFGVGCDYVLAPWNSVE